MTLEVNLYARDLKMTDRLEEYVDKKISKLDRYITNIYEARVDLAYVKSARDAGDRYVAQITIRGKGFILRAEERADDIVTAFDMALPKIQRRMKRYKASTISSAQRVFPWWMRSYLAPIWNCMTMRLWGWKARKSCAVNILWLRPWMRPKPLNKWNFWDTKTFSYL